MAEVGWGACVGIGEKVAEIWRGSEMLGNIATSLVVANGVAGIVCAALGWQDNWRIGLHIFFSYMSK